MTKADRDAAELNWWRKAFRTRFVGDFPEPLSALVGYSFVLAHRLPSGRLEEYQRPPGPLHVRRGKR